MNGKSFPAPDLLFDEEYADVFFKWEDGTMIPAHKNIVFKRTDYFKLVCHMMCIKFLQCL